MPAFDLKWTHVGLNIRGLRFAVDAPWRAPLPPDLFSSSDYLTRLRAGELHLEIASNSSACKCCTVLVLQCSAHLNPQRVQFSVSRRLSGNNDYNAAVVVYSDARPRLVRPLRTQQQPQQDQKPKEGPRAVPAFGHKKPKKLTIREFLLRL